MSERNDVFREPLTRGGLCLQVLEHGQGRSEGPVHCRFCLTAAPWLHGVTDLSPSFALLTFSDSGRGHSARTESFVKKVLVNAFEL